MSVKEQILDAALHLFTAQGFNATTVASIRKDAQVSNGSFFHAFCSKDDLGAQLYLRTLKNYHARLTAPLAANPEAHEGVELLVRSHLSWVVEEQPQARFLFDQAQSACLKSIRDEQSKINEQLRNTMCEWRKPLTTTGKLFQMPHSLFMAQLIGPAQLICRAWLSGRTDNSPLDSAQLLVNSTQRALVLPGG